jgi:hypothetical protein
MQEIHSLAEPGGDQPAPELDRLLCTRTPLAWDDWVRAWENDRAGQQPDLPLLHAIRLLPSPTTAPTPMVVA